MTKQEKQERRIAKRQLRAAVYRHLSRDFKAVATGTQLVRAAHKIADQLIAGKNPNQVVPL